MHDLTYDSPAAICITIIVMPKSVSSYYSYTPSGEGDDEDDDDEEYATPRGRSQPTSPRMTRRPVTRESELDLRSRLPSRLLIDDNSSLLDNPDGRPSYRSVPASPRMNFKRQRSKNSIRRNHSRHGSLGYRLNKALGTDANNTEGMDKAATI